MKLVRKYIDSSRIKFETKLNEEGKKLFDACKTNVNLLTCEGRCHIKEVCAASYNLILQSSLVLCGGDVTSTWL